ncbi:hypothetical protein HY839_01745 [Candidatus Azambacteria bacterium]|nr:hypothetical protein [Candidatus Azambacteria bacterium]
MSSVIRIIVKKKRWATLVLLFVVAGFVLSAQSAAAATCGWLDLECHTTNLLFYVLQGLTAVLAYIANITNWALQPSPITRSYFVQEGWKATRDFANMFFILILLAIALDFILFNSFGVKRALPKLLIIALLINFSIPIAGVLLDFANIVTNFFLTQVSQGGFTQNVAQSVNLQRALDVDTFVSAGRELTEDKVGGNTFINILFAIGMIAGMIFIFLALALMFLIRTGYISVLLILLPIALVLSAFPPTSKHFSKWMSKFTQWVMFAPAAAFFLYLSMLVLTATNAQGKSRILEMGGGLAPDNFAFTFLRYIMAWGLMLMSLTVAQSMGITTAGAALATWKKGTGWVRGKASQAGKRVWKETGGRGADAAARALTAPGREPGIIGGFAARQLQRVGVASRVGVEAREDARLKDKYKNYTAEEMDKEIQTLSRSGLNNRKVAKLVAMQASKGEAPNVVARTEAHDAAGDAAYAARNQSALRQIYDGAFVSEADRRKMRKAHAGLALEVLPQGPPGSAEHHARNEYLQGLRTSDIENMAPSTINEGFIHEMILAGSFTDSRVKAMFERNPAEFAQEVNKCLAPLFLLGAAQQVNNSGPWYPGTVTLPNRTLADRETDALKEINNQFPGMSVQQWRNLLAYTNSNVATQNFGIVPLPKAQQQSNQPQNPPTSPSGPTIIMPPTGFGGARRP